MEGEPLSFPENRTTDTPESLRECFKLRSIIANQLDDWCDIAKSHHPSIAMGGLAKIITTHCTPAEEGVDTELQGTPFETGLTPGAMKRLQKKHIQHAAIAEIAQNDSLDTVQSLDDEDELDALPEFFERIMSFTNNPNSPASAHEAVLYLHRIYTAGERVAEKLSPIARPNSQDYKYVLLLEAIFFGPY